jgi:hypothetical protein
LSVLEEGEGMKKKIKKIRFFCLLLAATIFVQSAAATTMTILPESSHYQGRSYFRTLTADGIRADHISALSQQMASSAAGSSMPFTTVRGETSSH